MPDRECGLTHKWLLVGLQFRRVRVVWILVLVWMLEWLLLTWVVQVECRGRHSFKEGRLWRPVWRRVCIWYISLLFERSGTAFQLGKEKKSFEIRQGPNPAGNPASFWPDTWPDCLAILKKKRSRPLPRIRPRIRPEIRPDSGRIATWQSGCQLLTSSFSS